MDDELRRLAWTITDLTFKLELTAVRELKAVCEKGVQKFGTPEFDIWEYQIRVHRMRARELKAKVDPICKTKKERSRAPFLPV